MVKKYRKKPVIIEAVQWNGKNLLEIVLLVEVLVSKVLV